MPETVTIPIVRPRGFQNLDQTEWAELVTTLVRSKEAEHRERRAAAGTSVLGSKQILRQKPTDTPASHERRFKLSPRLAAKNKWARIEAIVRNRAFLERYREAFLMHMAGVAKVVFPFGTYWMRKFGKVACENADGDDVPELNPAFAPAPA
jgi:hypothetical protein